MKPWALPDSSRPVRHVGYYLVEAKDLDEALGIAARIPTAKVGSIEVRPIMVYD